MRDVNHAGVTSTGVVRPSYTPLEGHLAELNVALILSLTARLFVLCIRVCFVFSRRTFSLVFSIVGPCLKVIVLENILYSTIS